MSHGGKSPRNVQEIRDSFKREKQAQEYMDRYYTERGHKIKDRQGDKKRDLILTICHDGDEHDEQVEEKFRFMDSQHGGFADILIEIVQDLVSGNSGWFFETGCDSLHYIFCTADNVPFKLYRIAPWKRFRKWWFNHLKKNKQQRVVISPKGYGLTVNLCLNPRALPATLIKQLDIKFDND